MYSLEDLKQVIAYWEEFRDEILTMGNSQVIEEQKHPTDVVIEVLNLWINRIENPALTYNELSNKIGDHIWIKCFTPEWFPEQHGTYYFAQKLESIDVENKIVKVSGFRFPSEYDLRLMGTFWTAHAYPIIDINGTDLCGTSRNDSNSQDK